MKRIQNCRLFGLTIASALALSACNKQPAPPPPAAAPPVPAAAPAAPPVAAPAPAPVAPPPAAAPTTSVTSVQLGNKLDANGMVASASTRFAPKDTIYAVVQSDSTGTATSNVTAKWTYGDGQLVNSSVQRIAATGAAHTSFHIAKPDGFPVGKYTLEISINGNVVNTTSFEVK